MQVLQMILLQYYIAGEMFSLSVLYSLILEETRIAMDQVLLQIGIWQPPIISLLDVNLQCGYVMRLGFLDHCK